jgi:hypothetical protein
VTASQSLSGWIVVLAAASPLCVRAQPSDKQVVVTGDAVTSDVLRILQDALRPDGIAVLRDDAAPDCSGTIADSLLRARVWVTWTPGSTAQICFKDHCQSAQRTLGPFSKLDARAREALITVIESSLAALPAECQGTHDSNTGQAPASNARASSSVGQPAARTTALGIPAALSGDVSRPTASTDATAGRSGQLPESNALGHETGPEPRAEPARAAHEVVPVADGGPRTSDADVGANAGRAQTASVAAGPRFALGASYGLLRWKQDMLAPVVSGMAAYALLPMPVYIALEVGYMPALRALQDDLTIEGTGLRLALLCWIHVALSRDFSLDAQIGPALQWLSLAPGAMTAALVSAARSVSHLDPALLVRLGPALRVYSDLWLGLDLGLDASSVQRSVGFVSRVTGPVQVFAADRLRLSIALYARVVL